ncbi:unnamed protein product [Schistosoma turkestanicum]|nr:unnamed protein product [Schistosoma turkestanicum]
MTKNPVNANEPYVAYLTDGEIDDLHQSITCPQCIPNFYTTRTGLECRRHFCEVCGRLAKSNLKTGPLNVKYAGVLQRQSDWISSTTMPDALKQSRDAMIYYSKYKH